MFDRAPRATSAIKGTEDLQDLDFIVELPRLHRATLNDFVSHPLSAEEIRSKKDYYARFHNDIANALLNAGHDPAVVSEKMKSSIELIDFNQSPQDFVADINSVLHDFHVEIQPGITTSTEQLSPASSMISSVEKIQPEIKIPAAELDNPSVQAVVLNETESPLPTLNQTNKILVPESSQPGLPILKNSLPETLVLTKSQEVSENMLQLEKLNAEPFNHGAYLEFTFEKHSELRAKYDAVLQRARKNLKRYSALYTPSKTEKEALQFLSSLQAQYAKTQRPDSEAAIRRAELVNSLNRTDAFTNEQEVKNATQSYLEQVEKIMAGVNKLEGLLEIVESEEKATVPDFYRAQLDAMQTDAQKVLTSLSIDHPRYDEVKKMVEGDLSELIKFASVDGGGDKNVFEQSSAFMSRREHIKHALEYLKKEHEYNDFITRKKVQIDKLVQELESFSDLSPEDEANKQSVINDVLIMRELINADNKLPELVSLSAMAESTLKDELAAQSKRKTDLLGYLGNATVILEQLRTKYQSREVLLKEPAISNDVLNESLEEVPLAPWLQKNLDTFRKQEIKNQHDFSTQAALERRRALETPSFRERVADIISKISPRKVGKVAAFAIALAVPINDKAAPTFTTAGLDGAIPLSQTTLNPEKFNEAELGTYIRSNEPVQKNAVRSETVSPVVAEEAPALPLAKVEVEEVVPGVVFNTDMVPQNNKPVSEVYRDITEEVVPGVVFNTEKTELAPSLNTKYEIVWGDSFWDISEGQSIAGKLPMMTQINPNLKNSLIAAGRIELNNNPDIRKAIGGFGDTADKIIAGQTMNLDELNRFFIKLAKKLGYL